MDKLWMRLEGWQRELPMEQVSELFIRVLYLICLWLLLTLWPIADQVWGLSHFIIPYQPFEGIDRLAVLLNEDWARAHYTWILYPMLALLVVGMLGYHHWSTRLVVWVLFVNLHFGNHAISNGGWHIMHHLLLLSIFLVKVSPAANDRLAAFGRFIHHVAFYFIWWQISLLYLSSGLHKFLGTYWLKGEAMLIILSMEEFSLPWIAEAMQKNSALMMMLTWLGFSYQLLFPVLIWVKRLRPYLLMAGLGFHLFIAFVVGVTDFGIILIGAYVIFLPARKVQSIVSWLKPIRLRRKSAGTTSISGTGD